MDSQQSMSPKEPSVYPDFFKTGIARLQSNSSMDEVLLTLFASLQQFQKDLKNQGSSRDIMRLTQLYLEGLNLVDASAFYLVNAEDLSFELAFHTPEEARVLLHPIIEAEMKTGRFAWSLRQQAPVFIEVQPETRAAARVVMHPLNATTHTIGMFCGRLKKQRGSRQEIIFSLLSILLSSTADALAVVRDTANLKQKILAADQELQRALQENQVLARIPAESPSPVIRLSRHGQVLYSNEVGLRLLQRQGFRVGDLIHGPWCAVLEQSFQTGKKQQFEFTIAMNSPAPPPASPRPLPLAIAAADQDIHSFDFLVVAVPQAGYANFYGTDVTERKRAEEQRKKMISELQTALQNVTTLSGLLPMCAVCKKIRDDKGYWNNVENYIASHSTAQLSHGICPDCLAHRYGQDMAAPSSPPTSTLPSS